MFCFSVFSMLGLFVFLVLFTAGGNLKTQLKHCRVFQKPGFQKIMKNMFKVSFLVDLGVSLGFHFVINVILLTKKGCTKIDWKKVPPK